MSLVVLDTDVASALLRRRTPEGLSQRLTGQLQAITFVTLGELTKWTLVRRWGPRSPATMHTFLAGLVVLPYDQRVAARWGELQAFAQLRGRPRHRPTNDTWTAVCCLVRGLPLATFDIKDFADYKQHEGPELIREQVIVLRRTAPCQRRLRRRARSHVDLSATQPSPHDATQGTPPFRTDHARTTSEEILLTYLAATD